MLESFICLLSYRSVLRILGNWCRLTKEHKGLGFEGICRWPVRSLEPWDNVIAVGICLRHQDFSDLACAPLRPCTCYMDVRGDVTSAAPGPSFHEDTRMASPLSDNANAWMRAWVHWAGTRTIWEWICPPFSEMTCGQGKIFPAIVSIYWFWQEWEVAYTPNTTTRWLWSLKCSLWFFPFVCFAPAICCSLFLHSTQITGPCGLSHTLQTWMRCVFPLIKASALNIFLSSFQGLWQFTLALPVLKNKNCSMHTQWKNENYGFAQAVSLDPKPTN